MLRIEVPDSASEVYCPLEVAITSGSAPVEPECSVIDATTTCECVATLDAGTYTVSVDHADGRTGSATVTYAPQGCTGADVPIELNESNHRPCVTPCESYDVCPTTSLGQLCIAGCCAAE